jgi:hypothetical protein
MTRIRAFWLLACAAPAACSRESAEPPGGERASSAERAPVAAAAAPALSAAPPPRAVQIDRASIIAFVNRWAELQNAGDFSAYSSLYAPDFGGVEHEGERTLTVERRGWLDARRPLFERKLRVLVSKLEILRSDASVGVLFEQELSSLDLDERGHKALTLHKTADGWRIVREELLSAPPTPALRDGPCAALFEQLASAAPGVRYFANLASASATSPRWVTVSSHGDADGRADDGYAWEFWGLSSGERWQAASVTLSAPSGDWAREASLCFRGDGSVATVIDRYRGLSADEGLLEDTITSTYARGGDELTSATEVRNLASGEPARTRSYSRPPPLLVKRMSELPFAALLR